MYRSNWGEDRVYYQDEAGCLRSLPAMWTSMAPEEPFVSLAGGRSPLRMADLLELVRLLASWREGGGVK